MSDIYKGELQDNEGNTIYPHTEADVTFCADGKTVQEKLNKTEKVLGNSTGTSSSLEVSDPNILATTEATNALKDRVTFPDGTAFYPDIKDGKYGFNSDPSRGADTFNPFNRVEEQTVTYHNTTNGQKIITFTFDNLKEVIGVKLFKITNKSVAGDASYFYIRGDRDTENMHINGNVITVQIQTYQGTADFSITAVGYPK